MQILLPSKLLRMDSHTKSGGISLYISVLAKKNLSELSVGFSCITCGKRPYLITLPVNQSAPRACTPSCLLTFSAGDETPSEAVKTQRTCRRRVIMQLFALHLKLMEAKTTSLRFFGLLFSSRQTWFLLHTYRRRRVPRIFTRVPWMCGGWERSGGERRNVAVRCGGSVGFDRLVRLHAVPFPVLGMD